MLSSLISQLTNAAFRIDPTVFAILMSSVIGPIVMFGLSEIRLKRQRTWDKEDRHRVANRAQIEMDKLHLSIQEGKAQAQSAYKEANGTNEWRGKLTADLHRAQAETLAVVRDTNSKLKEGVPKIVVVPAVVVKEDC